MMATLFLSLALLLGSLVGAQAGCVNKTIQLVDKTDTDSSANGTVEYCLNGVWRTLCGGEKWQAREAIVTCRQLGYEGGEPWNSPRVPEEKGFRLAQNCDSTENSIEECGGIKEAHDGCSPDSHGALECLFVNCTDQDVRLVGGSTNREGRVEVCMNGRWGTVCNNSQKGIEGAVCSKLGFPGRGTTVIEPVFVSAGSPIHRCNVIKDQVHCEPASNGTCNHIMDLWVSCRSHSEVSCVQNHTETCETCATTSETHVQPVVVGALGAIIGVLVALQAVTLTIFLYHRKCSKQSSQGHTTKRKEHYTFTHPTDEKIDASRQTQSNFYVRVEGDQEPEKGIDGQDPTIITQHDSPPEPRPYLVALEMKEPSKMSDWKVTSEAGTEGDDLNDAEQYTDPDAFMNKDRKNNKQSQEQTEADPYSTLDEAKSVKDIEDFYKAEQHTYSVVEVKTKKKAGMRREATPSSD